MHLVTTTHEPAQEYIQRFVPPDSVSLLGYLFGFSCLRKSSPRAVIQHFAVGQDPYGLTFDGANIWVTHTGLGSTVTKLRASDGIIFGDFPAGANGSLEAAFDRENIWVTNFAADTASLVPRLKAWERII